MTPTEIMIHHSASHDGPEDNTAAIRRWHMGTPPNGPADGPYVDVAYNALVELIGSGYEVIMGRDWDINGAHTLGHNDHSLGICLIGNFNLSPPPQAQLTRAAKQIAMWQRIYNIPKDRILFHREVNQTDCPGTMFSKDMILALLP